MRISLLILPLCLFAQFETDLTLLVWQAKEDGLEFAAKTKAPSTTDISATLQTVHDEWAPGFKLLLGYHFDERAWDLNLRWTWFYSRSERTLNENLYPLWIPPQAAISTIPIYSHAKGTFLFLMNGFDVELAYQTNLSPLLLLSLNGGLKFIELHQTFRAKYSGGFFDGTNQMIESHAQAKLKNTGAGPRVGIGSEWRLPHHFSLIAEMAGAFLLNSGEAKRKDHSIGTTSGTTEQISPFVHEHAWVVCPLFEGRTGLQWDRCYERIHLSFLLAYEFQNFWAVNMLPRFADSAIFYMPFTSKGNLILQGFSLSLNMGY